MASKKPRPPILVTEGPASPSNMITSDEGAEESRMPPRQGEGLSSKPQPPAGAAGAAGAGLGSVPPKVSVAANVPKGDKLRWTPECAAVLPKFDLVRQGRRTIEKWCESAKKITSEFAGPEVLMVATLVAATNLPEFTLDDFDQSEHSVESFLKLLTDIWNQGQGREHRKPLVHKTPSELWIQYLDRLKGWAAANELTPKPEWYLNQMRANIQRGQDVLCDKKDVDPLEWARAMDAVQSRYALPHERAPQSTVNSVEEESGSEASDEEVRVPITIVRRGDRESRRMRATKTAGARRRANHVFAETGEPICDLCKKLGHVASDCPTRGGRGGRGSSKRFKGNRRLFIPLKTELCTLGLLGFYRDSIDNTTAKTAPFQRLLEKNAKLEWGPEQQKAFEELKQSISERFYTRMHLPRGLAPYYSSVTIRASFI